VYQLEASPFPTCCAVAVDCVTSTTIAVEVSPNFSLMGSTTDASPVVSSSAAASATGAAIAAVAGPSIAAPPVTMMASTRRFGGDGGFRRGF
jgi:hypothetical protein